MKSKSTLSLIEQTIMVLVFALAAAICLKVFFYSDSLSKEVSAKDNAYLMAQNTAETVKNSYGKILSDDTYTIDQDGLTLVAEKTESESEYLGTCMIRVYDEDENTLLEMPVCWQEQVNDAQR